jgi:hypothetical protein
MLLLTKMRLLAMADSTLQGYVGNPANGTFRWFDTQLPQGYINQGTCVTVRQVSDVQLYTQQGPIELDQVRVQIDVRDLSSVQAKTVANYINQWLSTVSFASAAQFLSPPQVPYNCPNFKLLQRSSQDFNVQPTPAWVETTDFRIFNNVNT